MQQSFQDVFVPSVSWPAWRHPGIRKSQCTEITAVADLSIKQHLSKQLRCPGFQSLLAGMQCAIYGSFSGPKTQEIVVSRGNLLELLRPDENGKLQIICSTSVFGVIRALSPFSLAGTGGKEKQYIIIAGDSGRIVILEYNKDRNIFSKIHQETFGKSGCRRIVPGQYLAVDPRGRACMIGAVEKQKLVYVLNRDAAAKLTISSPLEAHKSHNIVFSICGLDNGFENPIFATIELDYADTDQVSSSLDRAPGLYIATFCQSMPYAA